MTRAMILAATLIVAAGIVLVRYLIVFKGFLPGYRGAVGVKNRSSVPMMSVRVSGFAFPLAFRNIQARGHAFNFAVRSVLPQNVDITWRTAVDGVDQRATIDLSDVPRHLKDGELFFAFADRCWRVEWGPELRIAQLFE